MKTFGMNTNDAKDIAYIINKGGRIIDKTRIGGKLLVTYQAENEIAKFSNLYHIEQILDMTYTEFKDKYESRYTEPNEISKAKYTSLDNNTYYIDEPHEGGYEFFRILSWFNCESFKVNKYGNTYKDLWIAIMEFEYDRGLIK